MENQDGQLPEDSPTSPEAQPTEDEPKQNPAEETAEAQTQDESPQEEGVKDRTNKRIRQLSQKAKNAEEALEELRQRKSVFDEFLPQPNTPPPPQPNYQGQQPPQPSWVNEAGEVDIAAVNREIEEGKISRYQAQQAMAQVQQLNRRIQEREAYSKYPELNPVADNHDDEFKQLVADRMARYWAQGIDKPLVEVADDVSRVYAKRQSEEAVAKKAVEKYKEAQQNRQQGPVEVARGAQREEVGIEKLREISRRGNSEQQEAALAERIRRGGF